jgi:hypothetical protein
VTDFAKRLFVGIKISKALQNGLDNPAPGTEHYFEGNPNNNSLQIINVGEHRFIGTYVEDGCPASAVGDAGRSICSMVKLITRGGRIDEDGVEIYSV